MKLKEKMAYDYTFKICSDFQINEVAEAGFRAGFEACKTLAIECIQKPAWMVLRDIPILGEDELPERYWPIRQWKELPEDEVE
jgi:hypothetical protein